MRALQRIPVLTYHSHRIEGTSYETNDHVAFCHDLRTIQARRFSIVPLRHIAAWVSAPQAPELPARAVGLSCDDGANADYYDCDHPVYGPQRSFYNILRDFQTEMGPAAQALLHMTSFVVASPGARTRTGRALSGPARPARHDGRLVGRGGAVRPVRDREP